MSANQPSDQPSGQPAAAPAASQSFPAAYLRADLLGFTGYASARRVRATEHQTEVPPASASEPVPPVECIWLNANEAAEPNAADPQATTRRYPDGQPVLLRERLATLWGTAADELLVTRGSDEAIDLLVRTACEPGRGAIVTTTPTFGMYAVAARLHGCSVVDVPQTLEPDPSEPAHQWARLDLAGVLDAVEESGAGLVFVATPGNPTGQSLPTMALTRLATALEGRALLVVDEAYADFAGTPSAAGLLREHENVVLLRTLSKAHGLAGARIGAVLARPELIELLGTVIPPYPLAAPATALAEAATEPDALRDTTERVERIVAERERMTGALTGIVREGAGERGQAVEQEALDEAPRPGSLRLTALLPSAANFLTVRCEDPEAVLTVLDEAGVVVRSLASHPGLADGVRITLGTPDQNDLVLSQLSKETP